jgi:phosphate starvation-inducible protein PhoH
MLINSINPLTKKKKMRSAMKKKHRNNYKQSELEFLLRNNIEAKLEGPSRKNWTMYDLKKIKPLTATQEEMFHAWFNDKNLCVYGSSGTGKTFISLYLALSEVLQKNQSKIIIVRSAVQTRDVGFLPGDLTDKLIEYETPYRDILWELIGRYSTYDNMKKEKIIEFYSTSFLRGLTFDNSIVFCDEVQNMTFHEIDSIMSRCGNNTRVIVAGDVRQTDLDGSKKMGIEGLSPAIYAFKNIQSFECLEFNVHDIVRSNLAKSWITTCEHLKLY